MSAGYVRGPLCLSYITSSVLRFWLFSFGVVRGLRGCSSLVPEGGGKLVFACMPTTLRLYFDPSLIFSTVFMFMKEARVPNSIAQKTEEMWLGGWRLRSDEPLGLN